jgi:hypothetical protein
MSARKPRSENNVVVPEGESLFELVSYMISAARLSLDEAPRYGSLRLVVGASRLIGAAEAMDGVDVDETLREWKKTMDENLFKVMNHYPEYVEWLGDLTREVAREATDRNLAEKPA